MAVTSIGRTAQTHWKSAALTPDHSLPAWMSTLLPGSALPSITLDTRPTLPLSPAHPAGLTSAALREAQAEEIWTEDTAIVATRAAITLSYQSISGMCVACAAHGLPHDHKLEDCQSTPAEDVREWQKDFKPTEGFICIRCWLPLLDPEFHIESKHGLMTARDCRYPRVLPTLGRELTLSKEFHLSVVKSDYPGSSFMIPFGDKERLKGWLFKAYGMKESFVQANLVLYTVLKRHDIL